MSTHVSEPLFVTQLPVKVLLFRTGWMGLYWYWDQEVRSSRFVPRWRECQCRLGNIIEISIVFVSGVEVEGKVIDRVLLHSPAPSTIAEWGMLPQCSVNIGCWRYRRKRTRNARGSMYSVETLFIV